MYLTKNITEDLIWIGASDRRLALFENVYPLPDGVTYNSYLLLDEKTVLFDTVDLSVGEVFYENLAHALGGRALDYIVVHHMEPDHSATLSAVLTKYPEAVIVCNSKILNMIHQFFDVDCDERVQTVSEGDVLSAGKHELTFMNAPMVHWPEVMFTYDRTDGTLFSADAFGTFGAFGGSIFADELDFERELLPEARRYYTNIVGKYGQQTTNVLKKAAGLEIGRICPLHGPVWRKDLGLLLDKYRKWAAYEPEEKAAVVFYASVYGHTQNAAEIAAFEMAEAGAGSVKVYDVSKTDPSYLLAEAFRVSHIVLASTTYNMEIFTKMEQFLTELKEHNFQKRTVAVIENGSWAPAAGKKMRAALEEMKDIKILDETLTIKSAVKEEQREQLTAIAKAVAGDMLA